MQDSYTPIIKEIQSLLTPYRVTLADLFPNPNDPEDNKMLSSFYVIDLKLPTLLNNDKELKELTRDLNKLLQLYFGNKKNFISRYKEKLSIIWDLTNEKAEVLKTKYLELVEFINGLNWIYDIPDPENEPEAMQTANQTGRSI